MPMPLLYSFIATFTVLASVRNAAAESCEEVWFVEGSFVGETFTCGERIVYLQTPQGGGKTEQEARVQASLEELKCADCWPWEKYREDGETERSPKRGIAIENRLLTSEALAGLSQIVSWGVTWDYQLQGTGGPDLSVWKTAGIDFVPLIWGAGSIPLAQADGLPEGSKALLGFNEPNFPNQANLDPHTAALHWKDVEQLAEENNISTIVSPSMNYHESMDPIEWLEQFLGHCNGCKVDAIGIHVFTCYAAGLKYHLDRYRALGKPMWITEIACSDWQSPERLSAEGQMAYMREAIPLLEADEDVQRYAWFSYFKDEWAHPIVDGENGDAGLVHPNGTLTPLGQLYNTFAAGTNLTEINITEPQNETSSTTARNYWSHTLTTSATTSKTATTTVSLTESTTGSSSRTSSTATTSISMTTITRSLSATSTTGSSTFTETLLTSTQTTSATTTTASASRTSTATRSSTKEATTTASATSTTESWTRSATASTSSWIPTTSKSVTSTTRPSETVEISSTTAGVAPTTTRSTTFSTNFMTTSAETATSSTTMSGTSVSASSTPEASTQRSSFTSTTGGGEFTTTEAEYDDEENTTNETDNEFVVHSCTEAVDAWCQSDPSSAPFLPLQHCADWRLRDAMCSSPGNANNAPQFAGTTELEQGSFPALFLLLAVLGAAMAGAALASLFNRQKCPYLCCCCGRRRAKNQDEEDLKHAISEKPDWQGNFLPVLCNKNNAIARVAPEPGLLLPMEAVARRVASSPHASEGVFEGSPVIGALSRKTIGNEVAIGTPVGTTPASRAAALTTLTEAMAKATSADVSLDEREIALHQAGRVLRSKAALNLPLALRQEAETWHSRQEERLNLAKSMEAMVDRATSLEEAAGCEVDADPLGALLSRAMVADKVELEALLRESARRASAFEDELDNQRLLLHREPRPAKQSLLTAADLMKQTSDLTEMQTKAARELTELQALQDPGAGEEWKTACDSLESKWKQFVADSRAAVEEAQAALAANRTAKILTSDAEREAALAEAARRQATFQEELQKQRQKLQKRTKAKSTAPTPLELGRLLEDEGALQALERDREEAMKECQQFVDTAASTSGEWRDLLEGWQTFEEDLANLSSHNQDLRERMPEGSVWASAGRLARLRKTDVSHDEQLAMLAEAARCAAAFDEELQKQRQQMKKRRKALQKQGGAEQANDSLDVCRTLADEEILKGLSEKQAEAHAKCQAMATSGEGMSEAWEQLAATWVQMEKDMNKAEKDVSETSKVVTSNANSGLVQVLGLAQDSEVARDVDDDSVSRRKALKEAAQRVAVFDEELSKQRAAVIRRRAANPSGARVLGHALLDGEALKTLAAECTKAEAACQAAAEEAIAKNHSEAEQWKDLLKLWSTLQKDLEEDIEQAAAEARACRAQEASEALAAAGLPAAVRQALKFEKELEDLSREGHRGTVGARSELQRAQKLASVTTLRAEHAKGLELCQARVAATGNGDSLPHVVECRKAWQELVELWQGLGKDLEVAAQELATERPEHTFWRKMLDTSVSEAERQTILAEAARCAAQFDQEFQQQRQRLVRRKKIAVENVGDRLLVLGNAVELQVLAKETEAAKSACERALNEAKASDNVEEAQGWTQVLDLYAALGTDMDAARKEVDANGSFSGEPDVDVGRHMVQKVIRDQKKSAASCLTAVELALNADRGPLEELMEAQQAPCNLKSGGASTNRSRNVQVAARVQMWDVLEEAQGLLDSFKDKSSDKTKSPAILMRLGDEASKQLQEISDTYSPPKFEEKPAMKEFGCQTVFRLGGMAWHPNPAIQHLLEELTKVSAQGDLASDTSLLWKLDAEVTDIINRWKNEFIGKRREASRTRSRSRSQSRLAPEAGLPAALQTKDSPQPIEMKVEVEAAALGKCEEVQDVIAKSSPSPQPEEKQNICGPEALANQGDLETPLPDCKEKVINSKVHDEESNVVRRNPPGRRVSSPGRLPSSRLAYSESRSLLPGSANSDAEVACEDKPASRPRRRRSLSRDDRDLSGGATEALPPRQPPCEPAKKEAGGMLVVPRAWGSSQQSFDTSFGQTALHNDLLAQLEMKLSGSQPLNTFSEQLHDSKNAGHPVVPSGRRGGQGPGDGSLLVPPPSGDVSRSLSPASSLGSSQSPGHMPRRLDPIVRPHAPPLPSAGRLLLATQERQKRLPYESERLCGCFASSISTVLEVAT